MIRAAALLAWLTLVASAALAQTPFVPLPADVSVTAPAADVPPAMARFSGVWAHGAWYGELPHVLIVERVDSDGRAAVVYAVGESSDLYVRPAATRVTGHVADGVLGFVLRDGTVAVEYRFDGDRLHGRYRSSYSTASVTLSRVTLAEAARIPTVVDHPPAQTVRIPLTDTGVSGSRPITLEATVYRPGRDRPSPVVVFNHGSTGGNPAIAKVTRPAARQARFFLERGFAVVAPMRRGRGASDGDYGETYGCASTSLSSGLARAVEDVDGVLAWLDRQPWADTSRLLMAGTSRGGFLSVVYAGERPQRVKGVVNFVGGWTGETCDRYGDFNATSFRVAGRAARVPMLWLYGDLDHYYGPASIRSYYDAFVTAGGRGALHVYPRYGHDVANHTALWEATTDAYLTGLGLMPSR